MAWADFLLFPNHVWLLISTLMDRYQCDSESNKSSSVLMRYDVILLYCSVRNCEYSPFITCMLTMAQVIWLGLTWSPRWLYQLILLTLSPARNLLSPSVCQPIRASLSSLQPCGLCLKSFNPIRLCKYFFARCLPCTSQIENSCPESVLFSSSKKQTAAREKSKSLKYTFTI